MFLESGEKQAISFTVTPQNYKTNGHAVAALQNAVLHYETNCGKAFTKLIEPHNPFVVFIIHGVNS